MNQHLISRLSTSTNQTMSKPRIIHATEHGISHSDISPSAAEVVEVLQDAEFRAELVGGCVRDLILGRKPKDFDVSTNARPDQLERIFRRCRIIGRRFKLAQIRVGRDTVEVATYRSQPSKRKGRRRTKNVSHRGRVLYDNAFGTIEQDAYRRDLTINSLYLDPMNMQIIDYTGGYSDARNRIIRVLGRPNVRFREDPVRILRVVRFASQLDFNIESEAEATITQMAHLLRDVPAARLADEFRKIIFNGSSADIVRSMQHFNLFGLLFPAYRQHLSGNQAQQVEQYLDLLFSDTDARVQNGVHINDSYTLAAILWFPYHQMVERNKSGSQNSKRLENSARQLLQAQAKTIAIPDHAATRIKDIWRLQHELQAKPADTKKIMSMRNFRSAVRLLELRAKFGEVDQEVCDYWINLRDSNQFPRRKKPYRRRRYYRR